MSDSISIQCLEVWTHIGVPDEERAQIQKLEISVTFEVKTVSAAALADDVSLTINYFNVAQSIKVITQSKERKLIETLAEDLANGLLLEFPFQKIELEIRKFIIPECRYISLKIKRNSQR
jgi:dihydroneopterin aldolase